MRWSGPWVIVGRVWPRHGHRGRPLNSVVRQHLEPLRKRMKIAIVGLLVLLSGCATVPDVEKLSQECQGKYRVDLPNGAIAAAPVPPLRIRPQPRGQGYACVTLSVSETGTASDSRLVEADPPEFGDYFLKLAAQSRYRPAMLDGKPFASKAVIS